MPDAESANKWIFKQTLRPYLIISSLDKMLAGNVADLADVRRFLDAQRGHLLLNIP